MLVLNFGDRQAKALFANFDHVDFRILFPGLLEMRLQRPLKEAPRRFLFRRNINEIFRIDELVVEFELGLASRCVHTAL
ncbi:MAG TPA: hypothetical protein DCS82_01020 [Rhodospirillaceae bacterium]|nr:hypothetical protein [Rhodospirillaceae bacterium]HAT34270.1 hypothetical protein [Rhodospirillaceae bacterium]